MPRRKEKLKKKQDGLKEKLIGIIMMLLSTAITHFIAMDILPITSCLLEKIMMFIKVYNLKFTMIIY
jgi:hypothetical protein